MFKKYFKSWFKTAEKEISVVTKKTKKIITKTDLVHKTKKELEIIGRNLGIEVDRRLKKDKLIAQIKKQIRTV